MEKSHLNVALGYLSVALGYFCLNREIRTRFESLHSRRTLEPLLNAIREFIVLHQLAANSIEGQEGARQDSGATERLERLVQQLEHPH
jgi:hypothetical protein